MFLRLAWLQIQRDNKRSLMYILNLLVGMTCFLVIVSARESLISSIYTNSKNYLGADLSVYSRQEIQDKDIELISGQLPTGTEKSETIETYTMVKGQDRSRLILLTAIERNFPFYGEIELQNKGPVNGSRLYESALPFKDKGVNETESLKRVWVYPEILTQLGVKIGEKIRIGSASFVVDDVVVSASGQSSGWSSMAPVIYMSLDDLASTELLQKGSTMWRSLLYKVPSGVDVERLEKKIDRILNDPALNVKSHISSGEQSSRIIGHFNDFLGLTGLVILFLTLIAIYFLSQSYLTSQIKSVATYKAIGLHKNEVRRIFLYQFFMLSCISFFLSIAITLVFLPTLSFTLSGLTPFSFDITLQSKGLVLAFFILFIVIFFLCYPLVNLISGTSVKSLFAEALQQDSRYNLKFAVSYLPLFLLFAIMSIWLSNSLVVGIIFWVGVVSVVVLTIPIWFAYARTLLLWVLPIQWRWHFLSWLRRPTPVLLFFMSILLATFLVNLLLSVQHGLREEISMGDRNKKPSLFIFDIQEEQFESLKNLSRKFLFEYNSFSPMIRAKLVRVNENQFEKLQKEYEFETRERQREERSRNRGMNLTYRQALSASETLIKGGRYVGEFNGVGLPLISIEKRFADRLGLTIGDVLVFEIQGVEVEAQVGSVRTVKWTSFEPNFFIQFPTGVLELAPKTYIATTPVLLDSDKEQFQSELFEVAPNASVIDVTRLIDSIFSLVQKMSFALIFISMLSVVSGFLIVTSITQFQFLQRRKEIELLSWLGVRRNRLMAVYFFESILIALGATLFGVIFSIIVSHLMGRFIFQSLWLNIGWNIPFSFFVVLLLVVAATRLQFVNKN